MAVRYTEQQAREAVAASLTFTEALRRLGMCWSGGNHLTLKKRVAEWSIPTDHFDPDAARRRALRRDAIPLAEVLVEGSTYSRGRLKERLYESGLKERTCELCGQTELWHGRSMSLILDHINGDARDNRIENLRIVCPNCAATLDTHCGRRARLSPEERRCKRCGATFRPKAPRQAYCSRDCGQRWDRGGVPRPGARKVRERPAYEALVAEIAATSWSAVGRKYGVSDNAIRKWVRTYELERNGQEVRAAVSDNRPDDQDGLPCAVSRITVARPCAPASSPPRPSRPASFPRPPPSPATRSCP